MRIGQSHIYRVRDVADPLNADQGRSILHSEPEKELPLDPKYPGGSPL